MKKVLILFGGNSYEHEVSCQSVNFIIKNIDVDKYDYKLVGIDFNNNWYEVNKTKIIDINWINNVTNKITNIIEYLKEFDIVFPIIHGNEGEDGKLQSLFELFNIKYVGCNSYSSIISYDKLLTKLILEKYSIHQVPYIIYDENIELKLIEYPVIIKPCKCGSSIGISIANNKKELIKGIKLAKKYDNCIIIEKFIQNKKELECAIIEKQKKLIISDVGEIVNESEWYDYDSKYKKKIQTKISNIDSNIKKEIIRTSKKIFRILKCKDLSRIDFIYDNNEKKLYFNEINTLPGFTEISMYPKLLINKGLEAKQLITYLLEN